MVLIKSCSPFLFADRTFVLFSKYVTGLEICFICLLCGFLLRRFEYKVKVSCPLLSGRDLIEVSLADLE